MLRSQHLSEFFHHQACKSHTVHQRHSVCEAASICNLVSEGWLRGILSNRSQSSGSDEEVFGSWTLVVKDGEEGRAVNKARVKSVLGGCW